MTPLPGSYPVARGCRSYEMQGGDVAVLVATESHPVRVDDDREAATGRVRAAGRDRASRSCSQLDRAAAASLIVLAHGSQPHRSMLPEVASRSMKSRSAGLVPGKVSGTRQPA